MKLNLKPVEPKPLLFTAELTPNDTIKIMMRDNKGRFIIEKSLNKTEAKILRARGTFHAS